MLRFVADFETCSRDDEGTARVWLWCITNVNMESAVGYNIESFIEFIGHFEEEVEIYFHNLDFDGNFILCYINEIGYNKVQKLKKGDSRVYDTLASDGRGMLRLSVKNDKGYTINFLDSVAKIGLSVAELESAYGLDISKGMIDYNRWRSDEYIATDEEIEYIENDCKLVMQVLKFYWAQGLCKMTIGSDAMYDFRRINKLETRDKFRSIFPDLTKLEIKDEEIYYRHVEINTYEDYLRQCYLGGFIYLQDKYANTDVGEGCSFDVNSMYPSIMRDEEMPYGLPRYGKGEFQPTPEYPVAVQHVLIVLPVLKDNKVPAIYFKDTLFNRVEWLRDVSQIGYEEGNDEDYYVELWLTNIELDLIKETYTYDGIVYLSYIKFRTLGGNKSHSFFKTYVDKWHLSKQEAKSRGDLAMTQISKRMLNNLNGKFMAKPVTRNIEPVYEDGKVKMTRGEDVEVKAMTYVPVAIFVTAIARVKLIRQINKDYSRFIRSDTDSIYYTGTEDPTDMDIGNELGQFKREDIFINARFVNLKTYIKQTLDNKLHITAAGLPKYITHNGTRYTRDTYYTDTLKYSLSDFHTGKVIPDSKILAVKYTGGISLHQVDYTIQ